MTQLAPHLTAFLREHLPRERRASVHTCEAYAYSFQLLVTFVARRLRKRPCLLQIEDLDFAMILAFSRSDRRTATRRYS
jgi:integrase/recombinase XerD